MTALTTQSRIPTTFCIVKIKDIKITVITDTHKIAIFFIATHGDLRKILFFKYHTYTDVLYIAAKAVPIATPTNPN